jgi:hypothetical protein
MGCISNVRTENKSATSYGDRVSCKSNKSRPATSAEANHPPFDSPWPKSDYFSTVLGLVLFFIVAGAGFAADLSPTVTIGGGATEFDGEVMPMISISVGLPVLEWLDVEWTYAGPDSHRLEYEDSGAKTYKAQPSWSTLGLRPHVRLGQRVDIGFPIAGGFGLITYRYDKEYREAMTWTEEYLDVVDYTVNTAGLDVRVAVARRWIVEAEAGWRFTSPMQTPLADSDVLNGYYATFSSGWSF